MKKRNYKNIISNYIIITIIIGIGCTKPQKSSDIFNKKINRVVCLSPAITGQMADLEAEDLLAGVTAFHPPLKKNVPIIGTLVKPNIEKIIMQKPDIILYSEEDIAVQNSENFNTLGIDIYQFKKNRNYKSICDNYLTLSKIIKKEKMAKEKLKKYTEQLSKYKRKNIINKKNGKKFQIVLLVSVKPLITVSNISYIGHIMQDAGAINCYGSLKRSYPYVTIESLIDHDPDIIISMIPGTDEEIMRRTQKLSTLKCIKNNAIYDINPDKLGLYTPKNYIWSVKKIIDFIEEHNKK